MSNFIVSTSPHIKTKDDITSIMRDVCIALAPAFAFALYRFGFWSIAVTVIAVLAAVVTEYICQKLRKVTVTINDYSAVVTGLLLAAVIPPNVSWYIPVIGSVVAIGIAKHCFGGLGCNIWNPALIGRAFLQAAYPAQINSGTWPAIAGGKVGESILGSFDSLVEKAKTSADIVTSATPLEQLSKVKETAEVSTVWVEGGVIKVTEGLTRDVFVGTTFGCIAEISALGLLIGGIYLFIKKIITWEIPASYIVSVALLTWILPAPYKTTAGETAYTAMFSGPWLLHIVGGGVFIGAFFMATDMVTTPVTRSGQIIFGLGCGFLTAVIRLYGGYPEGVCYSILLMNTVVPIIDSLTRPRVFGTSGNKEKKEETA
ncbi:MAG: RnfABCDGE type electron transport complex subunit D [Planctomycetota bacterium]